MQVVRRIIGSMYPNSRTNYLQRQIRPHPDLYGMSPITLFNSYLIANIYFIILNLPSVLFLVIENDL